MDDEEFETKKDIIEITIPPEEIDKAEKFIAIDDAKEHMKAIDEIEKYVKTTDDTKEHMKHRKSIDYIFVSQYMYDTDNEEYDPTLDAYVVTFSKNDNSIIGWHVNIKRSEFQPDNVYFQHDRLKKLNQINSFILCKKILVLFYRTKEDYDRHCIIDLNNNRASSDRFLELKNDDVYEDSIGFLPNGDLIQVSLYNDSKIYKYCFTNKPNNTASWEYSQIYDIEDLENLKEYTYKCCIICRTKLFLFVRQEGMLILQFDLLTMTLDRQYLFSCESTTFPTTVINKSQTLCASAISNYVCIFSMESGMLISKFFDYSHDGGVYYNTPKEFITLKNGFEGLIIKRSIDNKYRLIDPYQLFDTIEINKSIDDKNVITQLNRKVSIDCNDNVCITDGLDENLVQQTKTSIYDISTFIFIQKMLKDIIKEVIYKDVPKSEIEIKDGDRIVLERGKHNHTIAIEHSYGSRNYDTNSYILSLNLLNNQYLVQIDTSGIRIHEIVDEYGPSLECRYFWYNDEWNEKFENFLNNRNDIKFINDYIPLIKKVLANEFNDSKSSIPCPRFFISRRLSGNLNTFYDFKGFINDTLAFSKFGSEILKIAINDRNDDIVQHIIDKTFESIKNDHDYMALLPFVSLNLPKLCHDYPDFLIKFITRTSFILSPACNAIKRSTNTSLHSHLSICIKKSNLGNDYFKSISSFFKSLIQYLRIQEEVQTISFIVPFPQICVYQNHKNHKIENKHDNKKIHKTKNNNTKSSHDIKNNDDETENNQDIKEEKDHKTENSHNTKNDTNNIWNEFLYNPKSVLFCNIDSNHFYNWWNFAAIIDYKWKTFGWIYYYLIWIFYTIFYSLYALASTLDQNFIPDFYRGLLFIISILLGFIHLYFELRQCLWKPKEFVNDPWNVFDVGAYLLPVIVSIYWLINKSQLLWLIAISIILLSFKFLLFFRVFKSFGIYFAIIIGVAKKVFPFLVVLFFIVLGYAHAFFIILRSTKVNDANDPQNIVTKYDFVNSDGTINNNTTLIQEPDSNTNLFNWFPTSLLAVYKLITGDSGSLSPWTYRENHTMSILLITFTFFTVIYLMNLFIGLLNLAIDDYNKEEEFLLQKARIIVEIELFYMLPYQKHNKKWFPDWIYYDIPVTEVRKLINAINNDKTEFDYLPFISEKLKKLVAIDDEIREEKLNELENKTKKELKEEFKLQLEQTRKLLNVIIKSLNIDVNDEGNNEIEEDDVKLKNN
ncbi:hypothetical protein C1645_831819 [Glomus cerebriforme]|uniref:Ion transport domain-containing protein n=1 Tax=Glomus cerebriforme TaxID=658196 RepID=A0A397SPH0_9GLOM|nr:hypothetical protein C1645_831819 [Glomus cerebriforme]